MKRLLIVTGVLLTMSFMGCQESKDVATPLSEKDFYKTIGEEIPFETGMKWIELYRKDRTAHGRLESTPAFSVSAAQLRALLASTDELVGVAFHHALDDAGQKHIVVIPVDQTLNLWSGDSTRILVDANTNTEISPEIASAWTENYKNQHPDEKWFHFFGKDVFDQMSSLPYFSSMELEPAISELDYTPQLLLIVLDNADEPVSSSGRTSYLDLYGVVYDASNACPPCAVR